jgi:hypothetical protein
LLLALQNERTGADLLGITTETAGTAKRFGHDWQAMLSRRAVRHLRVTRH